MVAGTQVSLFDVSDPAAPKRVGQVVVSGARGEGSFDPHAFLYWQPTGLVVAPLDSWSPKYAGQVLVLDVQGNTLTKVGTLSNPLSTSMSDDGLGIQRSLLVDGKLWTLSGGGVQVVDPTTLAKQAWVPFG